MKGIRETRMVPFEVRAEGDGKLRGVAAVFNSETVIGGYFREVIRPGAFSKTIGERNIKMLWNHDTGLPMGSTKYGTLQLMETERGLEIAGDPPKEAPYSGFVENIKRGDVDSMSFGFEVLKEEVTRGAEGEMDLREILEVKLYEVSPVTFPAYTETEIALRAAEVAATWEGTEGKAGTASPPTSGGSPCFTREEANTEAPVVGGSLEMDGGGELRTTPEAGTSVPTSLEPDGAPEYILNRCELDAAEQEILDDDN